ncbi:MAG: polyprenyl synthetase family protein [Myxococcaceae bacterium]
MSTALSPVPSVSSPADGFNLKAYLRAQQTKVETLIADRTGRLEAEVPPRLLEAMRYSVVDGGKRLRPILTLAFAEAVARSAPCAAAEDAACAVEYIHTYSLIHDDLPAMDDDDLRRGRPTNHKAHGEAMAILAGDALLTEAFTLLASGAEPQRALLVRELAYGAGAAGMVGGQVLDIAVDRPSDEKYLLRLHRLKTGALIRAACRMGAISAGATAAQLQAATTFGEAVGLAFQIADDLLDITSTPGVMGKPTGADAAAGRFTFPAVIGFEESQRRAHAEVARAVEAVRELEPKAGPLAALARYSVERKD